MPSMSREITKESDLHQKLVRRLASRMQIAQKSVNDQSDKWRQAEERMLAFLPESSENAIRRARRESGEPQYTTIQLPYTYAITMALHTYMTSVFLGRTPVHQFQGLHGEGEQQVQALEALMTYQVEIGRMLGPYYIWLLDAAKYGLGVIGEYWDKRTVQFTSISEDPDKPGAKIQQTVQVPGYEGNKLYNISPFDFYPDPRVPVTRFQEGEFVGVKRLIPWNELIRRQKQGYYNQNVETLKDAVPSQQQNSSEQLKRPVQWQLSDGNEQTHPAVVGVYEVYVDLIPDEWELGSSDFPEKWVFTIDETLSTVIGVQPLGLAHGEFPLSVAQIDIEGYGLYTRGMADIVKPIQDTMDWLLNSHFYNVRAALNNQFIFDPSKVYVKDVEKGGPGFAFRLKPAAYGQKIDEAIKQIPVQDVTRAHVADVQEMMGLGERIHGVNEQILGVLSGSGRKTATEVRTSTGFGVNRLKTMTEYISAISFSRHALRMVQQAQQFYNGDLKLKIVGDLAQDAGPQFMNVTPELLVGNYSFVAADGTMPIDRMAQATLWKEIMTDMVALPQVMQGYDFTKIFAWVAQLGGLKNIKQFRVQLAPDAQLALAAQAGNVVPMRPQGGPNGNTPRPNAATIGGLNAMGSGQ